MADESDRDRLARELYEARAQHGPGCWNMVSLADQLRMRCPHCGAAMLQGLAPDVIPERAVQMLAELQGRRQALGLDVHERAR